ncbi:MAG: hypothetical protein DRH89_07135 [Candidatus Cloacimonadota bacterium]|nr:MAG: hypothetical protein DRH89_07135 [Candidatus Cloacimonadota bacterium]
MTKQVIHILAVVFFLLGLNNHLQSQFFYSTELQGIVKSIDGISISKAHIINLSSRMGTITNKEGTFELLANKSDIIQISSVGFKTLIYVIPATEEVKLIKYFTLSIDTIQLDEAIIYPFPLTLEELKEEFLELSMEEEPPAFDLHLDEAGILGLPQTGAIIHGPFSAIYEKFSRSAKFRRKYEALIEYDYRKQEASKIYNAELVTRITGLKSKDEIAKFMQYCEFEPDFVIHAKSYDLYLAIENCYSEFITIKE